MGMTVTKRVVQVRTVERRQAERSGERRVAGARVPGRTIQLDVYNAGKCAMRQKYRETIRAIVNL